jgi:hypothetical protein
LLSGKELADQVAIRRWRVLWAGPLASRHVLFFLGALLVFVLLVRCNPVGSRWFPPCPFKYLTGWYCPGCGSTRALHHLLHGRVAAAFGYNPLMVSCVPFLLVNGVGRILPAGSRRLFDERGLSPAAIICISVCVVLFGVLRNLPVYPFSILAPHG